MKFYESFFLSGASLSYNAGNWFMMIYMMTCGFKLNQEKLILWSLFTWLACLIIIPLIYLAISNEMARTIVTLIPVLICGVANGTYFPCVLDIGSQIDTINAQAMMAGNGVAGLIPQFLLIIIKGIVTALNVNQQQYDSTLFYQTLIYFVIGALFMGVCAIAWYRLKRRGGYKPKSQLPLSEQEPHKEDSTDPLLRNDQNLYYEKDKAANSNEQKQNSSSQMRDQKEKVNVENVIDEDKLEGDQVIEKEYQQIPLDISGQQKIEKMDNNGQQIDVEKHALNDDKTVSSIMQILYQIRIPAAAICILFSVTLAIFPSIIAPIPFNYFAKQNKLGDDNGWWNIFVMTTFMVFDWVGRQIAVFNWANKYYSLKACLIVVCCRVIFFALFLLEALPQYSCNSDNVCTGGPIIKQDTVVVVTMIFFALSNGWTCSVIMMKFQGLIQKIVDLNRGSNIQTFMLNTGLFIGGLLSLVFNLPFE